MDQLNEFSTWRVLIIDDEPDNLELAAITLEFNGAVVAKAADGQSGLAMVDTFRPTVILLDLSMPHIDGWEVQRRLRARPELNFMPIIAVTANAMPDDAMRVSQSGFEGYVTKPFRIADFLNDLKSFVAKANARKAAAETHEATALKVEALEPENGQPAPDNAEAPKTDPVKAELPKVDPINTDPKIAEPVKVLVETNHARN